MKTQTRKEPKFNNLLDVVKRFPDEASCREYLEELRWNGKPVCVHCGSDEKMYRISGGRMLKCSKCRKPFSVKVGTIFEDSALPLQKWFYAMFIVSAHKKGISSCQLAKDISVTQKTAWHMLHRIRLAMNTASFAKPLSGIVEVDETYIGGRASYKTGRGRGKGKKDVVFGMIERNGEIRAHHVPNAREKTLMPIINKGVVKGSTIMSDELKSYGGAKQFFDHKTVYHLVRTWVDGVVHTNNIESFWALLKRGIIGIYHQTSPKHLQRYCDEFTFRHNTRKVSETERFTTLVRRTSGKRLTYKTLVSL